MNTLLSQQPLQIYTWKSTSNPTSLVNAATIVGMGLFTTQQTDQPDLLQLFTDAGLNLATTTNKSARLYIKSACMDVQIKNIASTEVIIDVYTVMCVKDVNTTADIGTQFSTMYASMGTITGSSYADVAVSLFENPVFCQHYKILSKREMIILPNEISTMQMRYGKDRMIEGQKVLDYPGSLPKLAKFYILSFHGPPDPTAVVGPPVSPGIGTASIVLSIQKAYKYALAPSPRQNAQVHNA